MEFMVKVLKVTETSDEDARYMLQKNCTHVKNNYWLFEGEEGCLRDAGVSFKIVSQLGMESYGDMSGSKLIKFCEDNFGI